MTEASKKGKGRPKIAVRPISDGPPKKEIVLDQVLELMEIQCTCEEIASVFRVSEDTLVSALKTHFGMNFSELYKRVSGSGKASIRRYQFNQAKKNASMAIFLGKVYLGQRDADEKKEEHPNDDKLDELIKAVKEKG